MPKDSISKPSHRHRIRPTILLHVLGCSEQVLETIIEQADAFGWRLRDVGMTSDVMPAGVSPIGAIVRDLPDSLLVSRLRDLGVPVVRLGNLPHPQDDLMPAVLPDKQAAGRLAADHFGDHDFRHLAYIGHAPWSTARDLYNGFRSQARARGSDVHLLRLKPSKRGLDEALKAAKWECYRREVTAWLLELPKPLGLLAYSDFMAVNACEWCLQAGLAVPEEVAILGIGNFRYACRVAPVTLSSIDKDDANYARQAVCLLHRLISGEPPPPQPIMIPPSGVVERQSTNILAVPDPAVGSALSFMWEHFAESKISVQEITAEAGVCRRTLERGFRRYLGRSINAELKRKRLERCCELLRTTDLPVAKIAPQVGLSSGSYLQTAFTKAFGMTPREYRLKN